MASDLHIPQEILDQILEDSNTDVLRQCSLACRAWAPLTQKHLFKRVSISSNPNGELSKFERGANFTCRRFYQVLQRSTHLARYVREFQVFEGSSERADEWLATEHSLAPVLHYLTQLRRLDLHLGSTRWVDLPRRLQSEISSVITEQLVHLKITPCHFPSFAMFQALTSHAVGLQHLKLSGIQFEDERVRTFRNEATLDGHTVSCDRKIILHTYRLIGHPGIGDIPLFLDGVTRGVNFLDLTHLRSLQCQWPRIDRKFLQLLGVNGTLEELILWDAPYGMTSSGMAFSFAYCDI